MDVGKSREEKTSCREGRWKKKQHQRDDDDEMKENFPLLCAFFHVTKRSSSSTSPSPRRPFSRINNGHFLMPHNTTNPLMLLMFWLFYSNSRCCSKSNSIRIYICSWKITRLENVMYHSWGRRRRKKKKYRKMRFRVWRSAAEEIWLKNRVQTWNVNKLRVDLDFCRFRMSF